MAGLNHKNKLIMKKKAAIIKLAKTSNSKLSIT